MGYVSDGPPSHTPPPRDPMRAVVVSVGYGDFLAATILHNRHVFDYMVVVTSPDDELTRRACEHYQVHCVVTDAMHSGGAAFNKGRAINAGLAALATLGPGWLVHMDADVVLPPKARAVLAAATLDESCIYGIDRAMCPTYEAWAAALADPRVQHVLDTFVIPPPFPLGVRIAQPQHGGWFPIGFFQLWHSSAGHAYPEEHTTAARGDMAFSLKWPASRRRLIPDLFCVHLESEPAPMGANWDGRTTRPFAPPPGVAALPKPIAPTPAPHPGPTARP